MKAINRDFPNCNVQSYTVLRRGRKEELKDVNRSWLQYHVVMYSQQLLQVFCLNKNTLIKSFASFQTCHVAYYHVCKDEGSKRC